jgi:hypothetical protein
MVVLALETIETLWKMLKQLCLAKIKQFYHNYGPKMVQKWVGLGCVRQPF